MGSKLNPWPRRLAVLAAFAPLPIAMFLLLTAPARPDMLALSVARDLELGSGRRLWSHIYPLEAQALGLSAEQVERVVDEVLAPMMRTLNISSGESLYLGGPYEWYLLLQGSIDGTPVRMAIPVLQTGEREVFTSLSGTLLGLEAAERQAAMRQGRIAWHEARCRERRAKLREIGVTALYDTSRLLARPL